MPKSRRDRSVALTKTKSKKTRETKTKLVADVRACLDQYERVFVFSVRNMRNERWKQIRQEWKHSRFFFGKNRVLRHALGKTAEDSCRLGIWRLSSQLVGQCGLLFTNRSLDQVQVWTRGLASPEYARSGDIASRSFSLPVGPLADMAHSIEPHLRSLGVPVCLRRGVVHVTSEHVVCCAGDRLRPEQCRLLQLFGVQLAEFGVRLRCVWTAADGRLQLLDKSAAKKSSGGVECSLLPRSDDDDNDDGSDDENQDMTD